MFGERECDVSPCMRPRPPPPHMICDLAHEALERGAADESLGRGLILADLPFYRSSGGREEMGQEEIMGVPVSEMLDFDSH